MHRQYQYQQGPGYRVDGSIDRIQSISSITVNSIAIECTFIHSHYSILYGVLATRLLAPPVLSNTSDPPMDTSSPFRLHQGSPSTFGSAVVLFSRSSVEPGVRRWPKINVLDNGWLACMAMAMAIVVVVAIQTFFFLFFPRVSTLCGWI